MMAAHGRLGIATLVAGCWAGGPLAAQVGIGGDLTVPVPYVWRGVTRSQAVVVQPSAFLATGGSRDSVRVGVWMSIDATKTRADQLSDLGPGRAGLAETNLWLHYQHDQGPVSLALGIIGYRFRDAGLTATRSTRWNTTELYASVQARSARFAPRIDAWWDVDRVRGAYFEASASVPVLGNIEGYPFWAIYLRGLAGYSAGQERNRGRAGELAYFSSPGLTHAVLTASTNLAVPGVASRPLRETVQLLLDLSVQINRDGATKIMDAESPPTQKRVKLWATFGVSLPASRLF
jgi:hypothetical protein